MIYPVYVHLGDAEHAHGVTIPDFPGCFSAADDWQDLSAKIQEAIEVYCEGEAMEIPAPTPLEDLTARGRVRGRCVATGGRGSVTRMAQGGAVEHLAAGAAGGRIDAYARAHRPESLGLPGTGGGPGNEGRRALERRPIRAAQCLAEG